MGKKKSCHKAAPETKSNLTTAINPTHHGSHHAIRSDEGLKIKGASPFFIFKITHFVNYEKCCNLSLPDQYYTGHYQHWPVLAQNQKRAKSEYWRKINTEHKKNISKNKRNYGF